MRLCKPKFFLIFLITIFIIFNILFFFNHLINVEGFKDEKIDRETQINFLKNYVDFNHTAFINKGKVHFYYPAVENIFTESDEFENHTHILNYNLNKKCNFSYDADSNMFIDSNNNICEEENFMFKIGCCDLSKLNFNENFIKLNFDCDPLIKCCKFQSYCIKSCFNDLKSKNDSNFYNTCKDKCQLEYLSFRNDFKYCYTDLQHIQNHTRIILSKYIFIYQESGNPVIIHVKSI